MSTLLSSGFKEKTSVLCFFWTGTKWDWKPRRADGQQGRMTGHGHSSILVSYSRCNRLQTQGNLTQWKCILHSSGSQKSSIHFPGLKSKCQQGYTTAGSWKFLKFPASAGFQHPFAGGHITLICLYPHITFFSSVCTLTLLFYSKYACDFI